MNTWEYKTHFSTMTRSNAGGMVISEQSILTDAELTQLGSQGWELVNVVKLTIFTTQGEQPGGIQYIFKRPKA